MAIKIGINGMGRIGRMILRSIFERQNKKLKIQQLITDQIQRLHVI